MCLSGEPAVQVFGGDLPTYLEYAITRLLLSVESTLAHLHCAGVVSDGSATLAVGGSGAGKSTVALAWLLAGRPILGDDIVFLDSSGVASPFYKPVKAPVARALEFGLQAADTPYWHEDAEELWIKPEDYGGWAEPTTVGAIAFLDRTPGQETQIDPISPAECAAGLVGQFMTSGPRPSRCIDSILALATRAPAFRISFSSSRDAAARILEVDSPR